MESWKSFGKMGARVFLVLLIATISSAETELEETSAGAIDQSELMAQMQELLRSLPLILDPSSSNDSVSAEAKASCNCHGVQCICCQRISIKKIKLNDNCCLSVKYLTKNYGILVSLRFGSKTLFSKEVSARNPPPICAGVPYLKRGASVCIQFYNLNVAGKSLSGCSRFLARLLYVTVAKINLGCFRMKFLGDEIDGPTTMDDGTVDSAMDNAMELPYYDSTTWIESSDGEELPQEQVPMKDIERPLFMKRY